jgi:cyclopropane-fatty-acyl-phospholipid synthase
VDRARTLAARMLRIGILPGSFLVRDREKQISADRPAPRPGWHSVDIFPRHKAVINSTRPPGPSSGGHAVARSLTGSSRHRHFADPVPPEPGAPGRSAGAAPIAALAALAERGWLPDALVRFGIRRMLAERLRALPTPGTPAARAARLAFVEACRKGPIALVPELANTQHYEVPPAFFELVLGPHRKYSCGLWDGVRTLGESEERMLALTAARAGLEDGMVILDLGCGWGSFSLWAAERFPNSRIVAVSNSASQRRSIQERARERGLQHLTVTTDDINHYEAQGRFDRVVSIEMFEHVRNHEQLLARIAHWLAPDGKLFVHHFAHREHAYPYEDRGPSDWMARHFFSGGLMPSQDWLDHFAHDLGVEQRWRVDGRHYEKTSNAWLARLDRKRDRVRALFADTYGPGEADRWLYRWRIFFLACAELFGWHDGEEWGVAHVLLGPVARR